MGHRKSECWSVAPCSNCGKRGHNQAQCRAVSSHPPRYDNSYGKGRGSFGSRGGSISGATKRDGYGQDWRWSSNNGRGRGDRRESKGQQVEVLFGALKRLEDAARVVSPVSPVPAVPMPAASSIAPSAPPAAIISHKQHLNTAVEAFARVLDNMR